MKPANQQFWQKIEHMTYEQAERRLGIGSREFTRYAHLWHWSAPRLSSAEQAKCFYKYGTRVVTARINRLRRVLGLNVLVYYQQGL